VLLPHLRPLDPSLTYIAFPPWSTLELLRLLNQFLPRINFGKTVSTEDTHTTTHRSNVAETGFYYLKRDLVRLLGILCHSTKAVQDRARACGGIQVVMNLCVVDERNPCSYLLLVLCCDAQLISKICESMRFSPYITY